MKQNTASMAITIVVGTIALGTGFIIGFLLIPSADKYSVKEDEGLLDGRGSRHFNDRPEAMTTASVPDRDSGDTAITIKRCDSTAKDDPAIRNFLTSAQASACQAAECRVDLPRVYVAYKLDRADHIDIDGRLDEDAWQEVAWTQAFVDIGGEHLRAPRFESRVKVRWDDSRLYVGAFLQELAVWANKTLHDSTIYQDNSFQVLLDPAQSNHKYKEISINAMGTLADTMLTRPYMDDGEPLVFWESDAERAVHIEGPLNDPSTRNTFWTVEMAIPFTALYEGLTRATMTPIDRETWRANFVRSEWQTDIVNGKYQKRLNTEADWWTWQSPGVTNIHLPDRWGLLQFSEARVNSTEFQTDKKWLTTNALLDVYRAEKAYKAVKGRYTDKKELLSLPPYVLSKHCLRGLDIHLDWAGFRVTARPAAIADDDYAVPVQKDTEMEEEEEEGHTRTDRLLWFGDEEDNSFRR